MSAAMPLLYTIRLAGFKSGGSLCADVIQGETRGRRVSDSPPSGRVVLFARVYGVIDPPPKVSMRAPGARVAQIPILPPLVLKKLWSAALSVTVATSVPFL
jgi:hypothetical protein